MGRKGEIEGEKHQCERETLIGCLSYMPPPGTKPNPQPRHVPWLGIELVTFRFVGLHPTKPHQSGLQPKVLLFKLLQKTPLNLTTRENICVCLNAQRLWFNKRHRYRALPTQSLCGNKDWPGSELTCENNGEVPATGHLLDGTAKEGSAGCKTQNILRVTKSQLPVFVQATNEKTSSICNTQRLWWYCVGELIIARGSKRISLFISSYKPHNLFPTHLNKPRMLMCTEPNGIGPRGSSGISKWKLQVLRWWPINHQIRHPL